MNCTCGNTLDLSPDGMHCLSCAHAITLLDDNDDDLFTDLHALESAVHHDEQEEEAFLRDLHELDASIEMEIDEMYLLFDY
jgi:hypothetical protein